MTTILIDHNIEGQAALLFAALQKRGWVDLLTIRFVYFPEIGLAVASDDRAVWRAAQARQMLLLTANRSMMGPDSLEQTIREENAATSLPVLTISSIGRLNDSSYRDACADRIAEIVFDLDQSLGAGRLYIP